MFIDVLIAVFFFLVGLEIKDGLKDLNYLKTIMREIFIAFEDLQISEEYVNYEGIRDLSWKFSLYTDNLPTIEDNIPTIEDARQIIVFK